MKKLLALLLFVSLVSTAMAQYPLPTGRTQINLGVGLSNWGIPVYVGLDYGIHKDISLGAELSFRNYDESWNNGIYHQQIMGFVGNANYHFNSLLNIPNTVDFYGGINIGFNTWTSPSGYGGNHASGLALGAQIGGRVYVSKTVGLNLELMGGNGLNSGKFGVTFKL
jgi:outer membrane immunogenic protein